MKAAQSSAVRWIPRALGIFFAAFISLFALEAESIREVLIYLLPLVLPVIAAVLLGWRWPLAGAIAFFILTVAATFFFHTYRRTDRLLVISMPLLAVGLLFLLQWRLERHA